jgi:hypothetical protein
MQLQLKFAKLFCVAALAALPLYAQTYKEISYPTANSTVASGINDSNQIVGWYESQTEQNPQAYLYDYSSDTYTNINPPGSVTAMGAGINDSGVIAGSYSTTGYVKGFIFQNGKYTDVVYPDSSQQGTQLWAINNHGVAVGTYIITNSAGSRQSFGFIFDKGKYTKLDVSGSNNTLPNGINDSGEVVGGYTKPNGDSYGFTYLNGKYTTFNYPGTTGVSGLSGINNDGALVGSYAKDGISYGFELFKGKYTTLNYPGPNGAPTFTGTSAINKDQYIVGSSSSGGFPQDFTGYLYIP